MIIEKPQFTDIPALRKLWMDAFGDSENFWRIFLMKAHPLPHCYLLRKDDEITAALYWFDCQWEGRKIAYLYGVATLSQYRGQGLCRALLEQTHSRLKEDGYAGCILHPGGPELFGMYEKLGYSTCTYVREFECEAGKPVALRQLTKEEYALLRRQYLPKGGVIQEQETLDMLEALGYFYAGKNCLLVCASEDGKLVSQELLGDAGAAPGILATLGYAHGKFRIPGTQTAFTMYHSLTEASVTPAYFGLAMD